MIELPNVSIVVIGLNEEDNLDSTFNAIKSIDYPKDKYEIIYVDTNSTDRSVEIAKKHIEKVIIEKREWSTPGLVRNRGLVEAKYSIVHFIDGDVIINKDYLRKAVEKIQQSNIDAVYGYLEEKSKSGINDILLTHWKDRKEGYHTATGGGGTYKKDALLRIDGYDERIRKGQETELGERFLKAGFKIWFMNTSMGVHDYGVRNLLDLCKIFFLDGINKSHLHLTNGKTEFYKINKKHALNNLFFFGFFLFMFVILLYIFGTIGIFLIIIIYYAYFALKYLLLKRVNSWIQLKYFFLIYSMKFVSLLGQLKFYLKCFLDKEYCQLVINEKQKLIL